MCSEESHSGNCSGSRCGKSFGAKSNDQVLVKSAVLYLGINKEQMVSTLISIGSLDEWKFGVNSVCDVS